LSKPRFDGLSPTPSAVSASFQPPQVGQRSG